MCYLLPAVSPLVSRMIPSRPVTPRQASHPVTLYLGLPTPPTNMVMKVRGNGDGYKRCACVAFILSAHVPLAIGDLIPAKKYRLSCTDDT